MSFSRSSNDALSAVFQFLSAADLKSALQLNRSCRSIVGAMRCAGLSVCYRRSCDSFTRSSDVAAILGTPWFDALCSSPMSRRHVTRLNLFQHNHRITGAAELERLWSALPQLRDLITHVGRASPNAELFAWRFPSSLTCLDLSSYEWKYEEEARRIAIALGAAVGLTKLSLRNGCEECCPLPLDRMPLLRALFVDLPSDPSDAAELIDRIRAHPAIAELGVFCWMLNDQDECVRILDRLTAPPSSEDALAAASSSHRNVILSAARLRRLTFRGIPFDSRVWPLLTADRCPSLLRIECGQSESLRFLLQFPKLTALSLGYAHKPVPTADLVESLRSLHCMQQLSLGASAEVRSCDLAVVLVGMPLLEQLELTFANADRIDSLAFLADAAISGSLQRLRSVSIVTHLSCMLQPAEMLNLLLLPALEMAHLARIVDSGAADYSTVIERLQSAALAQSRRLDLRMVH